MNTNGQCSDSPIVVTTGEPAGIGPELIVQLLQDSCAVPLVVLGDSELLLQRAAEIGLELALTDSGVAGPGATARVEQVALRTSSLPGQLDQANVPYVIETVTRAVDGCLAGDYRAMVTGPVHKGVINDAGHVFSGHTEFIAQRCGTEQPVMMLATDTLRVVLVTIHLPLAEVPGAVTADRLESVLRTVAVDLEHRFGIARPVLGVCGLNPHAGEDGHLGMEEIHVITPVLETLRAEGFELVGPLPADTAFTDRQLVALDAVVAMYHDQGLPVIKHHGFGDVVNVTLGLPIVRTSVDHGTALDLAGTGTAQVSSLKAALRWAKWMTRAN